MEAKVDPKAGLQIGPNAYIITEIKTPEAGQKLIDTVSSLYHDDWVWNFNPMSHHVFIEDNGKRACFHPFFSFGTVGARGTKALTSETVAYWEVTTASACFGTSMQYGIGTSEADMIRHSVFTDLLGEDEHSFAISHQGIAQHNGMKFRFCPEFINTQNPVVGMLFNGPQKTLSYFINGIYIGTPFVGIDPITPFYPMVSSTAQHTVFILNCQRSLHNPPSLFKQATYKVASQLMNDNISKILPNPVYQEVLRVVKKPRKHKHHSFTNVVPPNAPTWDTVIHSNY